MTAEELASHFQHAGLEGLEPADLSAFAKAAQNPVLFGRMLFPKRQRKFTEAAVLLAGYAHRTADAMRFRRCGDVNTALRLEHVAESIYKQLPEYAKW